MSKRKKGWLKKLWVKIGEVLGIIVKVKRGVDTAILISCPNCGEKLVGRKVDEEAELDIYLVGGNEM